jgi:hypothetical protein
MRKPENRLVELNTYLRSLPPSHAATAEGCAVKHKIECIGNSYVTFHFEAGRPGPTGWRLCNRSPSSDL